MKKLLPIFIFFGLYLNSYSQTAIYQQFPTSNAIWREYSYAYGYQTSSSSCSEYQNEIAGDTVVGIYTYHKIWYSGKYYAFSFCHYPSYMYTPTYFSYYNGAYREDTLNRKVFYLAPDSISETLLYDFDLNLGDTLPKTYFNTSNIYYNYYVTNIVTSIDSILIDGKYHKRFEISSWDWSTFFHPYAYLIEGIGSTFGLLGCLRPDPEIPIGSTLLCFKQNGLTVFPDSTYQCDIISSIKDNEIYKEHYIQIFPNPFNLTAEISFLKNYKTIDLTLFDLQGKIIKSKTYKDLNKINLDRLEIENGIYFLRMTLDNRIIETKKIIITE
jgi:hypothetical protein